MREILFRGKRTYDGTWVYGAFSEYDITQNAYGEIIVCRNPCVIDYDSDELAWNEVDLETVGQYTGLTDKNGKKIFEGDILRYGQRFDYACYLESIEHPEEYDEKIYDTDIEIDVVEWGIDMDYPAFDFKNHQFECNGLAQIMCGDYEYEVIGNIHDNPELLEVKS